jgi:hypothetical protein
VINNRLKLASLGAFALLLAGCNFGGDKTVGVEKRAEDRWNFLIAHQAEKAYDYLTPGTREIQTRENYAASMNSRPVRWTAVKFNRKECDADRCKVYIDVSYSLIAPGTGAMGKPMESTSTQSETWVYIDNEWFFLPK